MNDTVGTSEFRNSGGKLLVCFVGMMFGISAIPFYTLGVFAGPITQETGWTMQQFQTAFTFIIVGTVLGPFLGHLSDKYGARPVAIIGIVGFSSSLAMLGLVGGIGLYAFYAAWALMAILGQGTSPVVWTHIIGHSFRKHRGLAFGIVLAGSGVFATFGPALANFLIEGWGWQAGYIILGVLALVIPLPLALLFLGPKKAIKVQIQDRPDPAGSSTSLEGKTFSQALKDYRFYLIGAAFLTISFGVAGLISNMVPLLTNGGMSAQDSAKLIGLTGLSVIAGRIVVGALLDRFWPPLIGCVALLLPAIACLLLLGEISGWTAALAVLFVGFSAGAEFDIVAFMASRYFGLLAYGKVYGILYITLFAGAAIAPPIFGSVLDQSGTYDGILRVMLVAFPVAAFSLLLLGRSPKFDQAEAG